MFKKILIANRGEIALRVIRACREMGIASVAVYSDADARAPHVREADEAVHIGAPPSAESYLKGDASSKRRSELGAEAIHPGYGFLSEREWFARAVRDAGLVVHRTAGRSDRGDGQQDGGAAARDRANVPVVPGTTEALRDADEARAIAEQFGYPVLLKAAAGGGGKGMRVVREPSEIAIGARHGAARSEERVRRRRGLRREVHRRPAPRRDPGARRPARHDALAQRARVLGAAPPSEDDRRGAERRGDAGASARDG